MRRACALVPAGKFESDQAYATRGVVTQVVSGLYKGFFIQDEQGDGDPATSDAALMLKVPGHVRTDH